MVVRVGQQGFETVRVDDFDDPDRFRTAILEVFGVDRVLEVDEVWSNDNRKFYEVKVA